VPQLLELAVQRLQEAQLEVQLVQLPELGEQPPPEAQLVQQLEVQRELRRQELGQRLHQNPNQ
jgi:hypothetical protein